jgi:hypothetical protein
MDTHANLLSDLLVNYNVNQCPCSSNTILRGYQVLKCHGGNQLLCIRIAPDNQLEIIEIIARQERLRGYQLPKPIIV